MSLHVLKRIRAHLKLSLVLLLVGVEVALAEPASSNTPNAMTFEIAVLPEARRHIGMFEYPPYLALALGNVGVELTSSGRITILDANGLLNANGLKYKSAALRYIQRKGPVYSYDANIEWDIGIAQTSIKLLIEIDISGLDKGKVNLRVFFPHAKRVPQELINRVEHKLQSLADINLQKRMLDYFDSLRQKHKPESGVEGTLNLILVQAYNRQPASIGNVVTREPGNTESWPDQFLLLITFAIWLVFVFLVARGQYLWRKYGQRRAGG